MWILLQTQYCKAYSMKDTVPSPGVKLTLQQARSAYKDLVRYDALQYIDSMKTSQLMDYKFTIEQLRKQIATVEERERNLKLAFDGQTLLLTDEKNRVSDLERKYKRSVRLGRLKVVLIVGALAYGIYQTIK